MLSREEENDTLVEIAQQILANTTKISQQLPEKDIDLRLGAHSDLWETHSGQIDELRSTILGLTSRLDKLLEGPHGFLHEYVSPSWEHGALYVLLEFNILQMIPLEEGAYVSAAQLAEQANLPVEKLLRICRLVATAGILEEVKEGKFSHTAISELLVKDEGFKSWVHFQYVLWCLTKLRTPFALGWKADGRSSRLFETRVASAHLAESLKKPNPFWTGTAAFETA
jgi:hypothetical protein